MKNGMPDNSIIDESIRLYENKRGGRIMAIMIPKSGMTFGPFPDEHCFHIEKSKIYDKLKNKLQIAEFLLIQPDKNKLLVVEAKSGSPNPSASKESFDDYITKVSQKLLNAFTLGLALCLERHGNNKDDISTCFNCN